MDLVTRVVGQLKTYTLWIIKRTKGIVKAQLLWICSAYEPLGEGDGTLLLYSCLENPMDRGAWWAAVHGAARSRTRLSDFTFTFHFHALEKEMATHSSVLAWKIPGTREPGGLPSMGSHRVGHNWSDLAAAAWACSEVYIFEKSTCISIHTHDCDGNLFCHVHLCWKNVRLEFQIGHNNFGVRGYVQISRQ